MTIKLNINLMSLIESSIGSLVGALAGGIIALIIARGQIKKGEKQFEEQTRHTNEMRIKSDKVNLKIVRITKDFEFNMQELKENRNRIFLIIESLEDFQEKIYQYLVAIPTKNESDVSKYEYISFNAKLLSAFSTTLQYTYTFAYNHSNTLNNDEMGDAFQKIEELYDLQHRLRDYGEKPEENKELSIVEINFNVTEKSREVLMIYIKSLKKLDDRIAEVHKKFEEDIKEENKKLTEIYSSTTLETSD